MCPLLAFILRLLAISNARSSPSSYTCKVYQQSFYPFKHEYPRKNSPDRSPCISLKNSLKTLIKDQRTLCLAIIFFLSTEPQEFDLQQIYSVHIGCKKVQTTANQGQRW